MIFDLLRVIELFNELFKAPVGFSVTIDQMFTYEYNKARACACRAWYLVYSRPALEAQ